MIEIKDLSFKYLQNNKPSIKNMNINIKKGSCVVISGPSGCGKSTLLRVINGLIPNFYQGHFEGQVLIDNINISNMKIHEISKNIATVFQDPRSQFFTTDPYSELAFTCENYGLKRDEILKRMKESIEIFKIDKLLNKDIFSLSSGEKQKLAISSVCTVKPSIFIFDEPSSNLDYKSIDELKNIIKLLKEKGHTIIISEHRLYYLKDILDELIYMKDGELVETYSKEKLKDLKDLPNLGLRTLNLESLEIKDSKNLIIKDEILKIENLNFSYKNKEPLLKSINITLNSGEVVGLTGKNGCGKTTICKLICGLIENNRVNNKTSKERLKDTCFVMQDPDYQLFSDSVVNELKLGMKDCEENHKKISEILKIMGLEDFKDNHPSSLSGGQKQRLTISSIYLLDREIVILDEPTSGLDYYNMLRVIKFIELLKKERKLVIIISHDYEFLINCCTRIVYLDKTIKDDFLLTNKNKYRLFEIFKKMEG